MYNVAVVCNAIEDRGFSIPSTEAIQAKESALQLKLGMARDANKSLQSAVDKFLLDLFNLWLSVPPTSSKVREQIWMRFSQFTSSDEYRKLWSSLYSTAGIISSPVLSFYVTYTYFVNVWKQQYPENHHQNTATETSHLTYDEENALWYIGGYIIRKILKKVEASKSSLKEELLAVINDRFLETSYDELDEDKQNEIPAQEELNSRIWLESINRGGLVKCSNDFYLLIRAVELELKKIIPLKSSHLGNPRTTAVNIGSTPTVQDAWDSLTSMPHHCEREDQKTQILELYVKVRFYAFTTKTVEHYKQDKLQALQKSKSLGSKLNIH